MCGVEFDEKEFEEADIYEVPIVTCEWVKASVRLGRLACTKVYHPLPSGPFKSIVAAIADLNPNDRKNLYALITFHGGRVERNFTPKTTHLVCGNATGNVYKSAMDMKSDKFSIVTPDWFIECLKTSTQELIDVERFHPRWITSIGHNSFSDGRSLASIIGLDDPPVETKKQETLKYASIAAQVAKAHLNAKQNFTPNSTIHVTSSSATVTTTKPPMDILNKKQADSINTKLIDTTQIVQRNIPNQTVTNQTKPTEPANKDKMVSHFEFYDLLRLWNLNPFINSIGTTNNSGIKGNNDFDTVDSSAYTIFTKTVGTTT